MDPNISRRTLLAAGGATLLAGAAGPLGSRGLAAVVKDHALPPLPYGFDALEPYIDAKTMEIHHDRHHQAYINNLNTALKDHAELKARPVEELLKTLGQLPESVRGAVRNNGGGHYNHTLFWTMMKPKGGGAPSGALAEAIQKDLGGFAAFQEAFSKAAATRFGSGWAWLVLGKDGKLAVTSTANQDNPISDGHKPLLGLDVWEHAYYLKYQNKRPDYVAAWWNVVNWDDVAQRHKSA